MATNQTVDLNYRPRPWQAEAHKQKKRWNVLVLARRSGKTVWAVAELVDCALRDVAVGKKMPRYAYFAPLFRQAKAVSWDLIKDMALRVPGASANEAELRVDLPGGARIQLFGAEQADALRGQAWDGVVLDEVSQMPPRVWTEVIRPALADRRGWAVWIGTPKGHNAFFELWQEAERQKADGNENWFSLKLDVHQVNALDPEEVEDARRAMSDDEFAQEFECSFEAAIVGAYYGKEMQQVEAEGRVCRIAPDPGKRCVTAWDLGYGDSTVIWIAQQVHNEIHLIDHIEGSGVGLDWYVTELQKRRLVFREHLLPHDAAAGELGTGRTREEVLRSLGVWPMRILPKQAVDDGIAAVRRLMPRLWFDSERCGRGVEALKQYRRQWDERGQFFRPKPLHDWTSHCLTGDTKVLTPDGAVAISELPPEGEVLTLEGWQPYRNPRITDRDAELVLVRFTDGLEVRCTPDHLLLLHRSEKEPGWLFAGMLRAGDEVVKAAPEPRDRCSLRVRQYSDTIAVEAVQRLEERQDVWCLTVPGHEHFALQNGALSHNSADALRYLCQGLRDEAEERARPKIIRADRRARAWIV